MKQKQITLGEFIAKLQQIEDQDAIVLASDYNGGFHALYEAHINYRKKGDPLDLPAEDAYNKFSDKQERCKTGIVYVGHELDNCGF
jgi:hypothetical protein